MCYKINKYDTISKYLIRYSYKIIFIKKFDVTNLPITSYMVR